MAYLIVKCKPLGDQWECDADRTPMFICDDWKTLKLDYLFEVYRINDNNTFDLVKDYETPMSYGMALYYWDKNVDPEEVQPTIIKEWPKREREEGIPKKVRTAMHRKGVKELTNELSSCGTITWFYNNKYWVYGEYADFDYSLGY